MANTEDFIIETREELDDSSDHSECTHSSVEFQNLDDDLSASEEDKLDEAEIAEMEKEFHMESYNDYDNCASSTFSTKQFCQKFEHKVDVGVYAKVSLMPRNFFQFLISLTCFCYNYLMAQKVTELPFW